MLTFPGTIRVYAAVEPVDPRKGLVSTSAARSICLGGALRPARRAPAERDGISACPAKTQAPTERSAHARYTNRVRGGVSKLVDLGSVREQLRVMLTEGRHDELLDIVLAMLGSRTAVIRRRERR